MSSNHSNNKRIAKNTIALYMRMLFLLVVSLYTSRVNLKALGVDDFGIYNVVGGIVVALSFLNTGMIAASQRFISYELGRGIKENLIKVFRTSLTTHIAIALIIIIVAETFGLWFVNSHLNIASDRMIAANWVYQFSLLSFAISVVSVPFGSCIIAHENFAFYAYISIFEGLMKLFVSFLIMNAPTDRLILYASMICLSQVSVTIIRAIYSKSHYEETILRPMYEKRLFRQMFSFAGWSVLGNFGFSFRDQGSNVVLNLFFGTTINAARGIAGQISSVIGQFSGSFTSAIAPQITKRFAAGNLEGSQQLVYSGARLTFFLLSLICVPFLINADYILKLWLGEYPEHTVVFIYFILFSSLLYTMSATVTNAIQATGNVKWFQIWISVIMLSEIPMAYVVLWLGGEPYMAMVPTILTNTAALYLRIIILKRYVPSYSIGMYSRTVVLRCLFVLLLCYVPSYLCRWHFSDNFVTLIISAGLSFLYSSLIVFSLGLSKKERNIIITKVKTRIHVNHY